LKNYTHFVVIAFVAHVALFSSASFAELPKPLPVPEELPLEETVALSKQRAALQAQWEKELAPFLRMHNETCKNIEEGSKLEDTCRKAKAGLENDLGKYVQAVKQFNGKVLRAAACAQYHGGKALQQATLEDMHKQAKIPFDTGPCESSIVTPVTVPPAFSKPVVSPWVAKHPTYRKLDAEFTHLLKEHETLQKELDQLHKKRAVASEKNKPALNMETALKKDQVFDKEKALKLKQKEMIDLSIKLQELGPPKTELGTPP